MRNDDPTGYVKMMAAILPKEVAFEHKAPLAELTDEQLAAVYASFEIIHDSATASGLEGASLSGNETSPSPQELN